ncbi:MAG: HAMP domain-containing protein [Clostridia bacterium]|nr:HAMP domain-containing protein [Clostridia bacterium]
MLVFFVIIGVSFGVMASRLTGFVSDYLYEQRIREDSLSLERLATTVAPLFQSAASDALNETLQSSGAELGGRLMVLDRDGKVQFDSYARLMGVRLDIPEVLTVLGGDAPSAYGIHPLGENSVLSDSAAYASYCAARLTGTRGTLGILLYVSTVTEMMQSLSDVHRQMMMIAGAAGFAAILAAIIFSHILTKPIQSLTRTIQSMGKGDLSVRARVSGSGEIRNLAMAYNTMAEQLEQLDQSRNQFVSNASHELKTPMTTMKILLENVLYQPDMPQDLRQEFLQDMNHEIDRLTDIVSDLLTLTRMDAGNTKMQWETIDLPMLVQDTIHLLDPAAEQRRQSIVLSSPGSLSLTADGAKLSQVLYNLIENAMKYSPDGEKILIRLSQSGKDAVIAVEDHGVGIAPEDQVHVFERFYRVDKARSRETGGNGLGLSIVRQLVLLHHGEITLTSELGKGSTFTVRLPLHQEGEITA